MKPALRILLGLLFIFFIKTEMWAGNNCNSATPIDNNLGQFETHSNLGTTNSGIPAPPCGDYISNDFWFSTTVPATGFLSVVLLPGTMTNPALAVYSGSCSNLNLMGCSSEDFCGNASAALFEDSGLAPGMTIYIRVWAVGGAPNGNFEIRVSESNPPASVPLDLDVLVGTAANNGDCVQLTTAINNQVSISVNGSTGTATPPIAPAVILNGGNIEDGQDHVVRIKWNGTTFAYEVYFDEVLVLNGTYDIVTNCLGGNPLAYWGTTSSTGGASNNQSICPYTPESYSGGMEQFVDVTICEGESFFAGGANQTLTVTPSGTSTVNETVCIGDCVTIGTDTYCNTGTFMTTLPNANYLGCDSVITLNLTVLSPQAIIVQNPQPIIDCANTSAFLDGSFSSNSSNITYQWTGPCILNGEFTPIAEVNCAGLYTLTITQIEGGVVCVNSTTVDVFDNSTLPIADAGLDQVLDCSTGCTFLDASLSSNGLNIIYSWTGPNGFSSSLQNPQVCEAGNYTLTVFNSTNNCVAGDVVEVTGSSAPIANAGMDEMIDCANPTATLDGSNSDSGAGFTLIWQDASGAQVGTGPILTTGMQGIYTLVVTNTANGCSSTDDAIISGNATLPNADAGADFR